MARDSVHSTVGHVSIPMLSIQSQYRVLSLYRAATDVNLCMRAYDIVMVVAVRACVCACVSVCACVCVYMYV